jgi:hypothetical protein
MPRTTVFGVYDHGTYGALERVADHLALPPPHQPRQRAWRIVANGRAAAGAIERPIVFGGNDRPGVMLARRRAHLCQSLWRGARARRGGDLHQRRRRLEYRRDLAAAGVKIVASSMPGRKSSPDRLRLGCARFRRAALFGRQRHRRIKGGQAASRSIREANGGVENLACDLLAVSGGWNPTIHLASHQGNGPSGTRAIAAFVPATCLTACASPGARPVAFRAREALADGARSAPAPRRIAASPRREASPPSTDPEAVASRRSGMSPEPGQGLRRLSERRHRQGHRARRIARAFARSSISSATPRSAWRPIRARPPTSRASRSWPN